VKVFVSRRIARINRSRIRSIKSNNPNSSVIATIALIIKKGNAIKKMFLERFATPHAIKV